MIELRPLQFREACAFILANHRHHLPPRGWLFGIAATVDGKIVGVATIGRPIARALQDKQTAELTRCCTDGTKNAASKLYAAAWRACRAMGYRRLITYTLTTETGISVSAAGWQCVGETSGGSWSAPSRPRVDKHPLGRKLRWEVNA